MSYQELYKVLTTELEWTKEIAEKHIEWLKNRESLWKKEIKNELTRNQKISI